MPSNPESAVRDRYAAGAQKRESALCCPVEYDPKYLEAIPSEVLERDYGCGDPSRWLNEGDTVLDLGSGTGKICFIAAQVVGAGGRVIGVDMTDEMLEVARRNAPVVAERIGFGNVEFRKGRIQDLALDLEALDEELKERPVRDAASYLATEELAEELRVKKPLAADESVDVVVSNCVLNLVQQRAKKQLFDEIFRVLRYGGRAVISDIVCDEPVPEHLRNDPELWSGCISGAFTEEEFLAAFSEAGFSGIEILKLDARPWRTVEGIEFRSMTLRAWKAGHTTGLERNQAVIYRGPFDEVMDHNGNRYPLGMRRAVCDQTFQRLRKRPLQDHFEFIEPAEPVHAEDAEQFDPARNPRRDPAETKGGSCRETTDAAECCEGSSSSCC